MARSKTVRQIERGTPTPKRTSIGKSIFSRPKNNHVLDNHHSNNSNDE